MISSKFEGNRLFGSRSFNISLACVGSILLSIPNLSAGEVFVKKTFPRLGGYQISSTPFEGYDDPEYQRQMARLDYVIIGQSQETTNNVARAIKSINPNIVLAKYTNILDINKTSQNFQRERRDKLYAEAGPNTSNAQDWWARDFSGNLTSNWPGNWIANITDYVKPDSNGFRFPEWAANQYYDRWMSDDAWDAWFEDVVFYKIRATESGAKVDWSGGKVTSDSELNAAFRRGHRSYWNEIRRLTPNKHIYANHNWYFSSVSSLPEYNQQVNGGLLERVMKSNNLNGGRNQWTTTLENYRRSFDFMRQPTIMMFVVQGDPGDYQFLRYTFATCLMNDGYFDYAPFVDLYGTVEWFDEFDLAGTATTEWLGLALDLPPTNPWQSGVWRRDFEGGVALVNPNGNGNKTITIEDGFRRISGVQDPVANNGQVAGTITLEEGDGLLLIRESGIPSSPKKPKQPQLFVE